MNNDLCKRKFVSPPIAIGLYISLQVMTEFLSPEEKSKLKILHPASSNRKQGDKIKAILLLDQGYEYAEIARILLIYQSNVWRWYESFITAGITGLLKDNYVGGTFKLTEVQLDKLIEHLECTMYLRSFKFLFCTGGQGKI